MPTQQIVFGGIDTESKEFFMSILLNRSKEFLRIHIEKYIKEKTFIHSDMFSSYIHYFAENSEKYRHDFVNHLNNFIDPFLLHTLKTLRIFGFK
ncbi:hypothetical protein H311_03034 [Anncaliia algerae PRA109]|nr:hypothetical protein H311_03034 [Anncaliia algerae PRA109]